MKPGIYIIAVGGLKEVCLLKAADFYLNRLKPVCDISVVELTDEPAPGQLSVSGRQAVLEREGGRIMNRIAPLDINAPLAVEGRLADLPFFCFLINKAAFERRRLNFIIGGSLGLAGSVYNKADYKISLSGFTLPHRLTRLLLLEIICQVIRRG